MLVYRFTSLEEFIGLRQSIKEYLECTCPQESGMLFVAINEAVNNAIFHGSCDDITPMVEIIICKKEGEVAVKVSHNGAGYNCTISPEEGYQELEEHGRGLSIISMCTDCFCYNADGTQLEMRKKVD